MRADLCRICYRKLMPSCTWTRTCCSCRRWRSCGVTSGSSGLANLRDCPWTRSPGTKDITTPTPRFHTTVIKVGLGRSTSCYPVQRQRIVCHLRLLEQLQSTFDISKYFLQVQIIRSANQFALRVIWTCKKSIQWQIMVWKGNRNVFSIRCVSLGLTKMWGKEKKKELKSHTYW